MFVHADMSVICLYVDDFMMVATERFQARSSGRKAVSSDVSLSTGVAVGRCQRPAGSVPGSVCKPRHERALCISGWQAGYLDCGAKVDHECHSMDCSR